MREYLVTTADGSSSQRLRMDSAHEIPEDHRDHPVLNSRRVRQVLIGPDLPSHSRRANDGPHGAASLRLHTVDNRDEEAPRVEGMTMVRRFRDNLFTLTHIARDPLLWYAEEGSVLSDLRETLNLTESALRQFESSGTRPARSHGLDEGILAMANVIESRVDRLFDRMERLKELRQSVFRLGTVLNGATCGMTPRLDEIDALAKSVVAGALVNTESLTLVTAEATDLAIRVSAHSLNVAQVVARLVAGVPAWREECALAVTAALLQDLGMVQVPAHVLDSPDPLTTPQRTLIRQHPRVSAAIVRQIRGHDERLVAAVSQHHERLDGSGYPDGRSGEDVNALARLLAVADTYVALQSSRAHRPALASEQAIVELAEAARRGRFDHAWTCRLPALTPHWLKIPVTPTPPSSAPALSVLAA